MGIRNTNRYSVSSMVRATSRRTGLLTVGSTSAAGRGGAADCRHQVPPLSAGRAGASRSWRYFPASRASKLTPAERTAPHTCRTRSSDACSPPSCASRRSRTVERLSVPWRSCRSSSTPTPSRRSSLIFSRTARSVSLYSR